jgi:hypothetical protein
MDINNITAVKKDLLLSKENATFQYYREGQLFYHIKIFGKLYMFPINVVETIYEPIEVEHTPGVITTEYVNRGVKLADDLVGADFGIDTKGNYLTRWVEKAIKNNQMMSLTV